MSEPLNTLLENGTGMDVQPEQHKVASDGSAGPVNGILVRYSPTLGKLAAALAKAQTEFTPVLKQVENQAYRRGKGFSKYADLSAVIDATRPALAKNGLVVIQLPQVDHERKTLTLTTRLLHSSDEWIENYLTLPAVMQSRFDPQSIISAMTYARRTTWQGIIGVAAEDDDDGNSASGVGSQEAANAVAEKKIKAAVDSGKTSALFYTQDSADKETFYVTGERSLMESNKELLASKGKWSNKINSFITDANGLEDYKYELNQRGVPFLQQGPTPLTAALTESIAQAKAKRQPGE